jgi:hypothetical protein
MRAQLVVGGNDEGSQNNPIPRKWGVGAQCIAPLHRDAFILLEPGVAYLVEMVFPYLPYNDDLSIGAI